MFIGGGPGQGGVNRFGLQGGGEAFLQNVKGRVESGLGGMGAQDFSAQAVDGADAGEIKG